MRRRHVLGPLLLATLPAAESAATLGVRSSGISGYSGNPATNGGQICNACHGGGTRPAATLSGPTQVETGKTYSYSMLISGGQKVAGGLDVSATQGTLVVTDPGTWLLAGEIAHTMPRLADANGNVAFTFDWTAPGTAGTAVMYGAGNSVDFNGSTGGDRADKHELVIGVFDCLVKFSTYGAGTAGSGGFVPSLTGTDGPCTGGYSVDITNGLGGAPVFLWLSDAPASIPYACGNLLVNPAGPYFVVLPFTLGGAPGVPGAGSLSLGGVDLTAAAGLDLYLQAFVLDAAACKNVALSNGLVMDIG